MIHSFCFCSFIQKIRKYFVERNDILLQRNDMFLFNGVILLLQRNY